MAHLRPSPAPVNPSSPSRGTWWNLRQNATLKKVLRFDYIKVTWHLNLVHERERMVTWGSLHQSKAFDHDIYFRLIMKSIIVSFNLISIAANIKRIQFEKNASKMRHKKIEKLTTKKNSTTRISGGELRRKHRGSGWSRSREPQDAPTSSRAKCHAHVHAFRPATHALSLTIIFTWNFFPSFCFFFIFSS